MFGLKVTIIDLTKNLQVAKDKASFRNLFHAAASIRKDAISTIDRSKGPSPPGRPPHTRRGKLPRAIRFHVDKEKESAVIGPMASRVGESAAVHEFGGTIGNEKFPPRPFMGPALLRAVDRFAGRWTGSIGE